MLLKNGADPTIRVSSEFLDPTSNKTPAGIAKAEGHKDLAKKLYEKKYSAIAFNDKIDDKTRLKAVKALNKLTGGKTFLEGRDDSNLVTLEGTLKKQIKSSKKGMGEKLVAVIKNLSSSKAKQGQTSTKTAAPQNQGKGR